jgi:hypothetical protein
MSGEWMHVLQRSYTLVEAAMVISEMIVKDRIALESLATVGACVRVALRHASSTTPGARGDAEELSSWGSGQRPESLVSENGASSEELHHLKNE